MNPCSLDFKYLTPASSVGGQDITISLEEMVFEFSPGLLTTLSNVVTAFTGQQKVCLSLHYIVSILVCSDVDSDITFKMDGKRNCCQEMYEIKK